MSEKSQDEDAKGLDPIALTLALWLGVIAGTTGLIRMSRDAATQTALAQAAAPAGIDAADRVGATTRVAEPAGLFNPRLMAFGG